MTQEPQTLPPDPIEGITRTVNQPIISDATSDSLLPPDFDDWSGHPDRELSSLLYQISRHGVQVEYYEDLISDARDRLMDRLGELGLDKFECPLGMCQLAKNPGKVVLAVKPSQLSDRFQKVTADTKAIRQALGLGYDVPAHIEAPERVYRLVVKLNQ